MWLSESSAGLWIKGSPVQFPARAYAWIVGQVRSRGPMRGIHTLMFPSSLPFPSLKKKKKNLKKKKVWESLHYSVNSLGVRRSPPDRYYKPVLKKYLWNEHQFIQEGIHKAVKKFWKGFPWPADIKHCLWNEWLNKKFKCIQSLKISNGKFVLVTEFIVALLALYFFFH